MKPRFKIRKFTRISIKQIDIISAVVFLLCIDVRYVNNHSIIPERLLLAFRVGLIGLYCILIFARGRKRMHSYSFIMLALLVVYLAGRTVMNGTGFNTFLLVFSRPFLICVFYQFYCILDLKMSTEVRYRILSTWRYLLLVLVALDLLTMFLYPSGMYATNLYTENWFLGYKTERLVYCLPLVVFDSFLTFKRYGKSCVRNYLVIALCVFTNLFAGGTASLVSLLVFLGLLILLNAAGKFKTAKKILRSLFTYKVIIPAYVIIVWLVVWVQNSAIILYIVENILGKDPTLTTRTAIWSNCLKALQKSLLFGYGYNESSFFINLTSNIYATSPHSLSLSILLYGGIVGAGIYILVMACSMRQHKGVYSNARLIFTFGILAMLLNGVTSSTMVFSVFGFIYYVALENETVNDQVYSSDTVHIRKHRSIQLRRKELHT